MIAIGAPICGLVRILCELRFTSSGMRTQVSYWNHNLTDPGFLDPDCALDGLEYMF